MNKNGFEQTSNYFCNETATSKVMKPQKLLTMLQAKLNLLNSLNNLFHVSKCVSNTKKEINNSESIKAFYHPPRKYFCD